MLGLGRTRAQTRSNRSMSLGGELCSLEWFVSFSFCLHSVSLSVGYNLL